MFTEKAVM